MGPLHRQHLHPVPVPYHVMELQTMSFAVVPRVYVRQTIAVISLQLKPAFNARPGPTRARTRTHAHPRTTPTLASRRTIAAIQMANRERGVTPRAARAGIIAACVRVVHLPQSPAQPQPQNQARSQPQVHLMSQATHR